MRKRIKKIKSVLVICVVSILLEQMPLVYAEEIAEQELYAKAAVLMDAESGRILYGKNATVPMAMASTTKIMTLLVTLEKEALEKVTTVSAYAASMPNVQLHMKEGEQYYIKDLVYSLMLESHNDTAVAIAEEVGGSVEGFAQLMNDKAKEIGCTDTFFITPNGLDATAQFQQEDGSMVTKEHMTTAKDLAKIMSYCVDKSEYKEKFLNITQTPSYSFSDIAGKRQFHCTNHNVFLTMMSGVISGKTGFTNKAGYCYVGALERDGRMYVVALLACGWPNHKNYKWSDAKKLLEYGMEHYQKQYFSQVRLPQHALDTITVMKAKSESIDSKRTALVEVVNPMTEEASVLAKKDEPITIQVERVEQVTAPIKKGTVIGRLSYMVGGEEWNSVELQVMEDIEQIDYTWCIRQILLKWTID